MATSNRPQRAFALQCAAQREASLLERDHRLLVQRNESTRLARMLHTNTRKAHREIKAAGALNPKLDALRDATTGIVYTAPGDILRHAAAQYAAASVPPHTPPGGPSPPPWTAAGQVHLHDHNPCSKVHKLDPFCLRTALSSGSTLAPATTISTIFDQSTYNACLNGSKTRREPGPDGVPNEILKALPSSFHDMLFALFRLQLRLGLTCPSWKHSETILLYKAGDPTNLSNHRPIGLANTVYKLWTSCLQVCLSRYCESGGILSCSQSGFRPARSCHDQLMYLTSLIEDSNLRRSPLFLTYIDFKGAFPSVPHDKLLEVMALLQLPADSIDIVADLYRPNQYKCRKCLTTPTVQRRSACLPAPHHGCPSVAARSRATRSEPTPLSHLPRALPAAVRGRDGHRRLHPTPTASSAL